MYNITALCLLKSKPPPSISHGSQLTQGVRPTRGRSGSKSWSATLMGPLVIAWLSQRQFVSIMTSPYCFLWHQSHIKLDKCVALAFTLVWHLTVWKTWKFLCGNDTNSMDFGYQRKILKCKIEYSFLHLVRIMRSQPQAVNSIILSENTRHFEYLCQPGTVQNNWWGAIS